jgi:glycosyltransferase involved in cell wall biosynthesis
MLFSVLIANYNNSRFLDEALKSVYSQTYSEWEVILVDDGSTDEFEEVIKAYSNDPKIKIFRNGINKGCSYTKRKLAANAAGEILAFLDPDDSLHFDALLVMIEAHQKRPDCSIIHSTHYVCDEFLNPERVSLKPKALPEKTPYLFLSDGSIHAFATFKKNSYNKTEGLTPLRKNDKAIDQELYYILEEAGDVHFINMPLYYYRIHSGSISNWGNEVEAMKSHFTIIEEACRRRIKKLKLDKTGEANYWIKKYRTRYYKVRILNSFRKRYWLRFTISLLIFPFIGGMENIINYFKKLPREGFSLIRKSFAGSYKH